MAYPNSIDSFTAPSGTSLLTSPDHANLHATSGSAITAIENKLGINTGSAAVNQLLFGQGAGSTTWGSVGTALTFVNTTNNNGTLGTPSITGGTIAGNMTNNGTIANGVYGTAQITGGTIGSTTLLQPLNSAFSVGGSSTLSSGAVVPFSTTQMDLLSEYNGTYFIPKQSGIYLFGAYFSTSGNAGEFNINIQYNGTIESSVRANNNGFGIPITWLGTVSAAGSVSVSNTGGTGAIGTASYFWGKRVY